MSRNEHDENLETVRRIARHLDELAEGERHIKCPKCSGVDTIIENETAGDNETVPEDEREYYETIEAATRQTLLTRYSKNTTTA